MAMTGEKSIFCSIRQHHLHSADDDEFNIFLIIEIQIEFQAKKNRFTLIHQIAKNEDNFEI